MQETTDLAYTLVLGATSLDNIDHYLLLLLLLLGIEVTFETPGRASGLLQAPLLGIHSP